MISAGDEFFGNSEQRGLVVMENGVSHETQLRLDSARSGSQTMNIDLTGTNRSPWRDLCSSS